MRALIAGLGLIGGSIGMALRARGWRVAYVDPQVALDDARRAGAADDLGPCDADLVVVATPVDVAVRELDEVARFGLVTTVCSVLRPFDRDGVVAGHPLAGSQERGLAAARADLFRGARWFVTRHDAVVDRMIEACGATIDVVSAEEHDRAVALTSHLPQLLSTALAAAIDPELLRFAGPGLQTFLRLAGSDASVWSPIVEANRDHLDAEAKRVAAIVEALVAGDRDAFAKARALYARLSSAPQ